MTFSVNEFASSIKKKYPQYNEMPDDSLALLVIKKFPQYKKYVDLGTLQAKYFKTAKDFGILSDDDISGFSAPSKVASAQPVQPSLSTVSGGEFSFLPGVMALANEQPSIPGITSFPSKPTIPSVQATPNASSMVSESASSMNAVAPGTVGNVVDQRVQANKLSRGPSHEMSSDEILRQGNQFQLRLAAAQKKWDDDYKLGKIPMKTIEVPGDMGRPASMSVPSIPRPTENSFTFEEAGVPLEPGSFQRLAGDVGTMFENVLGPATGLLLNRKAGERRAITFNEKKIAAEGIKAERELAQKEASGIELTPEEKQLKETLNPGVWDSMVEMAKQVWNDPKRFAESMIPSMTVGVLTAPAMDAGIGFVASRVRDAARVYKLSRVRKILKARREERLDEAIAGGPVVETTTAIDDVVSRYANQVGLQNARRAVADALIAGNDSRTLANALQKVGIRSTKGQRRLIANIGSEMAEEVGPVAFFQTVTDWGQGRGDLDAESIVTNVFSSLPIAAVGGGVMEGASAVFRNHAGMEAPVADRVAGRFMLDRGAGGDPDYVQGVSETVSSPEFQSTADRLAKTENSPEVSRHFERLVPEIGAGINDSRIAGAGEDAFVRGRMQNRGAFTIGETAYGGGEAAGVHEVIHGVERFIKANPDTHGDVEVAIQDWKDQAYSDLRENNPELFKSLQSMTRTEREAKEELFAQTMTRALGYEDNDWGLTMEPALLQRFSQYIGQSIPERKSATSGYAYVASAEDLADVPFSIKKNDQEKPRLRVTHNLDESKLEKVDKLGGFAKPSLAVMRADQPATSDFGDITLVGKKELGDPRYEPVFDRDVYSPRIPSKTYKKSKKLDEFISSMYKSGMEGSKYSGHGYVMEKLNNGDKDGALRFVIDDEQAMSHYLKENGKLPSPVVKSDITEDIFKNNDALQNAAIKLYENDEMLKLKKLLYNAISSYYEKKSKTGSVTLRKRMKELSDSFSRKAKTRDVNDVIAGSFPGNMVRELISQRNGEIDSYATRDLHKKIIGNEKEKYIEWWNNKLDELMPESSALIEGTRKQFNLENIVDAMKGIKAKEKSMTYSTGHAKAAAAEQFSDIEQMRNAAIDRMMPKNEDGEKDNSLFDYVSKLANYTKYSSSFSAMDYASEAIGKLAAGAVTESRARSILSADHNVTPAAINTIMDAANSIKKVMTDMFEAKPQRAVGFDEFSGAVVPENASQKTLDILRKRGISRIEKYKPGDIESRTEALNRFTEDQFSVVKAGIPESIKKNDQEKPRLRVTHNLDESKLEKVDKLGGFAKPSLAVMRADQPATSDFGDITLVGKKELGDPRYEPVFDRDVFSPRVPSRSFRPTKKLNDFFARVYRNQIDTIGDSGYDSFLERLEKGDKDSAISYLNSSDAARAYYLKETNQMPSEIIRKDVSEDIFKNNKKLQDEAIKLYKSNAPDSYVALKELLYNALAKQYESLSKKGSKSLRESFSEMASALREKAGSKESYDIIYSYNPNEMVRKLMGELAGDIDEKKTKDRNRKIVEKDRQAYLDWWKNKLDEILPESSALIEGTRKQFNLENIVDAMKGIKAKEKSMTYSTGHAKAAAAEQFSNIEQMRNAAIDRMMPKNEDGEKDNSLFDYVSKLANYTKYSSSFSAMDYASEAIGKLAAGAVTESRARSILSADHNVTPAAINTIMDAANSIKKVMTDMFEAKPQRAVGFDEFSGAVVPENASQKTLDILSKRGISRIEKYKPGDIESRTEALNRFTEDQFSVVKAGIPESKKNDPKVVAEAKRQWKEKGTDSPFFKRWFGDSKVVDSDGNPMIMYHGTPNKGFGVFNDYSHFTNDRKYAERYMNPSASSSGRTSEMMKSSNPGVYEVYLAIKKPFDTRNSHERKIFEKLYLGKYGNNTPLSESGLPDWTDANDLVDFIKEKGLDFDGVVVDEGGDEGGHRGYSYIPLESSQVKLANENSGTFDPENSDIRYSLYPRNDRQKAQRDIIKAAYAGMKKNGVALQNKISLNDISQKWGSMPSGLDDEARSAYRKKWDSALEYLREFLIEDEPLAMEAGISKADLDNENIQEIVWKLSDWANAMSEKPKKSMEGFTAEDERMLRGASPEVIAEYEKAKAERMAGGGKKTKPISKDEQRRVARYTPPEGMAVDEWNTANDIGIPHGDPTASYKDAFGGQVAGGENPETKTDIIVRQVYDYLDPLKKIQVRLTGKESGGAMNEAMLQASRAQDKVNKVKHSFLDPVKKIMEKSGLTLKDVDRFLYARHAIERNEKVALINEDFRDPENQGGSGMSNKTARAIMKHYEIDEPEKFKALQRIGIINDRMNKWRIDYARSAGILTPEEEAAYEKSYKHYVPLRGRADGITGEIKSSSGMKKGMQAHKSNKRALGRRSMAESVTAQNFTRTLEIVSNAEKNKVGLAVAKMVRDNPDPEFWTIDKTPMKYVYDKKTGEAKRAPDMKMNAPNEFTFYENGERHTIRFNTKEGLRIATALNGMSDVTGNTVLKAVSKINRMLTGIITTYSPEFVFSNAARDAITASITSSVRDGAKVAAKTISGALMAAAAITGREFGKNMGEWGKYYQRFTKAGGKTAFLTLESFEDFAKNIESDLMDVQRSSANPKKVFKNLIHAIERVNAGVENGARLAYFRNLVESGMSDEDAALKAKELTVNFERHGQQKWMNQLWMFMNASLQGAANIARLFTNEKTRKAAIGAASTLVAVGASNALMNKELGGSDDESGEDYWDRIQPWEKDRNIVFLNPLKRDGSGVRLPLPYEFSFFIRLGQELVDMGYGKHPLDVALSTVNSAISAVSPLGSPIDIEGGGIKNPIGLAIPTPFQPFADISKNRDYSGRQIHPEDMPFGAKRPESQKYYPGVNPIIRDATTFANRVTGGNEHESGMVDINPENIEHIINAYTGGIGALLQRGSGAIKSAVSPDETVQVRQIPFVRKFFRGDMGNDRADFKKIADKAGQVEAHYVSLLENGKNSEADKYENENYLLISTARIFKDAGKGIDFTSKDQRDELNSLYKRSKRQFKRAEEIDLKLKESTDSEKQKVYRKQIDSLLSSAWDGFMDGVK